MQLWDNFETTFSPRPHSDYLVTIGWAYLCLVGSIWAFSLSLHMNFHSFSLFLLPCCWVSKAEYLQRRWQACIEARTAKALTEGEAFHGVAQKCLLVVSDPWEVASRTFPLISPSSLSLPRQARPPLATTLTPRMSKSNYLNTAAASEQNGGECNEGGNPAIKIRLHEDLCILTPATWQLLSASFCVIMTTTAIKESFLQHQFDKKP